MTGEFGPTGHVDTFARDNLPPRADWPAVRFAHSTYPAQLNCAAELLDAMATGADGDRPALHFDGRTITYRELLATANRIAHVLWKTSASCRAIACCCAARTTRCWSPAGSPSSKRAQSP